MRRSAATAQRLEFYQIRRARREAPATRTNPKEPVDSDSALCATTREQIERAAHLLQAGALVAFPTETVYGLGADARNAQAVRRIFEAKGRPAEHPVIVHLARADLLPRWAREIGPSAR